MFLSSSISSLEVADLAVDAHAHVAGAAHVLEDVLVLAFAPRDQRGEQQQARAVGQGGDGIDDLLDGLAADLAATLGAVWMANARVEQAHDSRRSR